MRRIGIIAGCISTGAIAVAGCGGSSTLSKSQLDTKVNALCSGFIAKAKAIPVPSDFTSNPKSAATYLDKVVAAADPTATQIKALKPDSSVQSDFNAFTTAFSHDIDLIKTAAGQAHAADKTGLNTLAQESAYDRSVTRPAGQKLGFTSCSTSG